MEELAAAKAKAASTVNNAVAQVRATSGMRSLGQRAKEIQCVKMHECPVRWWPLASAAQGVAHAHTRFDRFVISFVALRRWRLHLSSK